MEHKKIDYPKVRTASIDMYGMLKEYSRTHRCVPTDAEYVLWSSIRKDQLGVKFRRQHAIGDFIVDFVCLSNNLIIEVDGDYHLDHQQKIDDFHRQQFLENLGYRILRFSNDQVLYQIEDVIKTIKTNL